MSIRTRYRSLAMAGVLALTSALVAGCVHAAAPDSLPPSATADWPAPAGVSLDVPVEPTPATESCDATASLTPGPLPPVAQMLNGENVGSGGIAATFGVTLLKVCGFIGFMLIIGRRAIPAALHWVALTGSR